jgi:hypothetical protein
MKVEDRIPGIKTFECLAESVNTSLEPNAGKRNKTHKMRIHILLYFFRCLHLRTRTCIRLCNVSILPFRYFHTETYSES